VFVRTDSDGNTALYVVKLSGGAPKQITPSGMPIQNDFSGGWSPSGNRIVFAARPASDHRFAVWVVKADGTGLHQVPITPACGGAVSDPASNGCFYPSWSPDGTKIAFGRFDSRTQQVGVYTVNVDGSDLFQVTHRQLFQDGQPDWGSHPLAT
jgi:TolB protein